MEKKVKSSFLCLDALRLLPKGEDIIQYLVEEKHIIESKSFVEVLKTNPLLFVKIQTFLYFRFFVLQYDKGKHWMLRYDGRHLKHLDKSMHLEIWLLDENGCLIEKRHDGDIYPRLHSFNYRQIPEAIPLWQLLELQEPYPDPTCFQETIEFLMTHDKENVVEVNFLLAPGRGHKLHTWNSCQAPEKTVGVFTKKNGSIGFTVLLTKKHGKKKCPLFSETRSTDRQIDCERQANRSSAVSVKLTGLNLALSLGCLSDQQFSYLSSELGKCYLGMWMEFDEKFQVRFVSIFGEKMLLQTQIITEKCWEKVFSKIEEQKEILKKKKENILLPFLKKLERMSQNTNSLYKKCEEQLKTCIKDIKIVVFSPDDTALHGIKLPFANYLKNKHGKKFYGLTLNGDAKNDLVLIKYTEIAIFNLNIYLNSDVIPSDALPTPHLRSDLKQLKWETLKYQNMTVLQQCKKRGQVIAPSLLKSWKMIGLFFMQHFHYDIFSILSMSLSKLSYDTIWTKYGRQGGIFHHALEKTKIAYEKTLRSFSNGGFSYSAREELKVNEPIFKTSGNLAQTLIEIDLISSYGYAGSHISVPKGFCTGYLNNGNGSLICSEPFQRYNSFEFLSVYYTLWKLTNENVHIKNVYSNFHQAGIFSIGNYPIDLVVITSGAVLMYQFDGDYAHGCKHCASLPSYIHGKSKEELEKKTSDRDQFILTWASKVNIAFPGFVKYFVKTNCHDKDYSMPSLSNAFQTIPILNALIKNNVDKKLLTQNDVLSCSNDLMYIMIAEGFIPTQSPPHALLISKDKKWTRQHSTGGQPMMFTKDYADWLMKTFNFQFTVIHQVFFFRKCTVLNSIFKDLTVLRMTPNLPPSTKQLIKMVINYTAGYFGLNQNGKTVAKYKIVSNITRRKFNIVNHKLDPIQGSFEHDFYVKTVYKPANNHHRMSFTGVPIFCCIVEFGKLRMSQILCLFETCLCPLSYRHLYTNVDNVVFVLSTSSLNEAVQPEKQTLFENEKPNFFLHNTPGHLKEEFKIESHQNWKFVTAAIMNYVIVADNFSVQKNCALNGLSFTDAYNASLALLNNKKLVVSQNRRVNKIVNKDVQMMTLTFNP